MLVRCIIYICTCISFLRTLYVMFVNNSSHYALT
jgi:hypothetical protein